MRIILTNKYIQIVKHYIYHGWLSAENGVECIDYTKDCEGCELYNSAFHECRLEDGEKELKENFPEYYI